MKRVLKIISFFSLGMFLLILTIALFTQTSFFKKWLLNEAEKQINSSLNGHVQIGRMRGNFIRDFSISNILFISQGDTIVRLSSFRLAFKPVALLRKQISVQIVAIDSLSLFVEQEEDGQWNFEKILKSTKPPDTTANPPKSFSWHLQLENIDLRNANVYVKTAKKTPLLESISDINARLSATYSDEKLTVILRDFNLSTFEPDFSLKNIAFHLTSQENILKFTDLTIESTGSHINGNLEINSKKQSYQVHLNASPFDLSELIQFFPDIPLHGVADMKINGQYNPESLAMSVHVIKNDQKIKLEAIANNLRKEVTYRLHGTMENFKLDSWLDKPPGNLRLSGDFRFAGKGLNPERLLANLDFKLNNIAFNDIALPTLSLNADYKNKNIKGNLAASLGDGKIAMSGCVNQILSDPQFHFSGQTAQLNLARLVSNSRLNSEMNARFQIDGRGFNLENNDSVFKFALVKSEIFSLALDSLVVRAQNRHGSYQLDQLDLISRFAQIKAEGSGHQDFIDHLKFAIDVSDASVLKKWIPADSISATGKITGTMHGKFDSPKTQLDVQLSDLLYNKIRVDRFSGQAELDLNSRNLVGKGTVNATDLAIDKIKVDSVRIASSLQRNKLNSWLHLSFMDSLGFELGTRFAVNSPDQIEFPQFVFHSGRAEWRNSEDSMRIRLEDGGVLFENFRLFSGNQFIEIDGKFSPGGSENLQFQIARFDLSPFSDFIRLGLPYTTKGKIDLYAYLSGNATAPKLSGYLQLQDFSLNARRFPDMKADLKYADNMIKLSSDFTQNPVQKVSLKADIPLYISLQKAARETLPNEKINISLTTKDYDIAFVNAFLGKHKTLNGKISADLNVARTKKKPIISGHLELSQGSFEERTFGMKYQDIRADISVDSSHVLIDRLSLRSGEGNLQAKGRLSFDAKNFNLHQGDVQFNIAMEKFLLARSKALEAIVNSQIQVDGKYPNLAYNGKIDVLRSVIFLPALQSQKAANDLSVKPLLLPEPDSVSAGYMVKEKSTPLLVKNLRGQVKLEIPRNTWIKSPETNIEISGSVDLVKNGPDFELFGSLQTVRGTYNLYGRRFNIQEGTITFKGGRKINPEVNIKAAYTFRDAGGDKKILTLLTTGEALKPKLSFTLGDTPIVEVDGISYLILGRSSNELTRDEKTQLTQGGNSSQAITQVLTGQIAGQITRTIQRTFNLDVIEFKGSSNWRQASIVLGKYLTNNLYMSYEKEFDVSQTREVVPEKISLEYEIKRHLFLQATKGDETETGFDLIWKIEKK